MTCEHTQRRLTAYLDGELDADEGTLVRGHLRGCAACRRVAEAEAALRDGLRALPTLDPPPALWAGVQARLAAAEEAEARRPRWRRVLARAAVVMPRAAAGGLVAAAAVTVLWWRGHRGDDAGERAVPAGERIAELAPGARPDPRPDPSTASAPGAPGAAAVEAPGPRGGSPLAAACREPEAADVTADLAADAARGAACYEAAAEELLALARAERPRWSAADRAAFDGRVLALREAVDGAEAGRPRQRALRAMIRYLQGALVRDEVVALASGGGAP